MMKQHLQGQTPSKEAPYPAFPRFPIIHCAEKRLQRTALEAPSITAGSPQLATDLFESRSSAPNYHHSYCAYEIVGDPGMLTATSIRPPSANPVSASAGSQ